MKSKLSKNFNSVIFIALLLISNSFAINPIQKDFLSNSESKSENIKEVLGIPENTQFSEIHLSQSEKPMENSGYLFYGYNLYRGNPHSLSGSLDPGFTNPIFDADYSQGTKTGDLRFSIPAGSLFSKNVGCDVSMSSSEIKGASSYAKSLEAEISIGGGFAGIAFSASSGYKQISEGTKSSKTVYIESKADCRVFKGHIEYYNPPLFYSVFVKALKYLSEKDFEKFKDDYYIFIDYYGTHFIDTINMGARFGYMQKMSAEEYSSMNSSQIKAALSASGYGVSGSASFASSNSNSSSKSNSSIETKIISIGAPPPADGNTLTWAASAINEPMPISYKLRPFMEIFNNSLFNLKQLNESAANINIIKLRDNLKKAHDNYCSDYLKKNGSLLYCSPSEVPQDMKKEPEVTQSEVKLDGSMLIVIRNTSTNTCMTVQGMNIVNSACDKNNQNQRFMFVYDASTVSYKLGFVGLRGKCVDRAASNYTSLLFWDCHAGENQKFRMTKRDFNTYQIVVQGLCLIVRDNNKGDNAPLGFDACKEGEPSVLWRVIPA